MIKTYKNTRSTKKKILFLVVQCRVVSIETIYTQTIKTDFTGSIYIHLHTHICNKYNQGKMAINFRVGSNGKGSKERNWEIKGRKRGGNYIILLN